MAYPSVFNLYSEAEPFAEILIAHRTHVFWGGTPEARMPRAGMGFWGPTI